MGVQAGDLQPSTGSPAHITCMMLWCIRGMPVGVCTVGRAGPTERSSTARRARSGTMGPDSGQWACTPLSRQGSPHTCAQAGAASALSMAAHAYQVHLDSQDKHDHGWIHASTAAVTQLRSTTTLVPRCPLAAQIFDTCIVFPMQTHMKPDGLWQQGRQPRVRCFR